MDPMDKICDGCAQMMSNCTCVYCDDCEQKEHECICSHCQFCGEKDEDDERTDEACRDEVVPCP